MGAEDVVGGEQERDADREKPDLEGLVLKMCKEGGSGDGHGVGL